MDPNPSPDSLTEHKQDAARIESVQIAVVTVSDTRTVETDKNGQYLKGEIDHGGHSLVGYRIIPDEPADIEKAIQDFTTVDCDILLFNGGTGVGPRDTTIDIVKKKLEKEMLGFGEIFRMLDWEQIGSAAMLSRALAGLIGTTAVFCLPGSSKAVQLGWERLIEPELKHLVWEQKRSKQLP